MQKRVFIYSKTRCSEWRKQGSYFKFSLQRVGSGFWAICRFHCNERQIAAASSLWIIGIFKFLLQRVASGYPYFSNFQNLLFSLSLFFIFIIIIFISFSFFYIFFFLGNLTTAKLVLAVARSYCLFCSALLSCSGLAMFCLLCSSLSLFALQFYSVLTVFGLL